MINKVKLYQFFLKILLIGIVATPIRVDITHSAELEDALLPCINQLMASDIYFSYYSALREFMFVEDDVANHQNLARMIVSPPFSPEEYIVVYKKLDGKNVIKYSKANISIWSANQFNYIPPEYREKEMPRIEDLKISTHERYISNELAEEIWQLWRKMLSKSICHDEQNRKFLDSTVILFSAGDGTCGMTTGVQGKKVRSFVDYGFRLRDFATMPKMIADVEDKLLKNASTLSRSLDGSTSVGQGK